MGLTKRLLDETYNYDYIQNQELDILYQEFQHQWKNYENEKTSQIRGERGREYKMGMSFNNDEIHTQRYNKRRTV